MMQSHTSVYLPDLAATAEFARLFAKQLQANDGVFLFGDLGAGKTTFTRFVLSALGYEGIAISA